MHAPSSVIYMGAALAGLLLAVFGIDVLLSPAKTLNITLFRPYRRRRVAAGRPGRGQRPVRLERSDGHRRSRSSRLGRDRRDQRPSRHRTFRTTGVMPSDAAIEETTTDSVVVEPLHAEVHRAAH